MTPVRINAPKECLYQAISAARMAASLRSSASAGIGAASLALIIAGRWGTAIRAGCCQERLRQLPARNVLTARWDQRAHWQATQHSMKSNFAEDPLHHPPAA